MRPITTQADIVEGLDALCVADPRLVAVRAVAGEVPLRRATAGFESLASIIVSQQVSRASADAIMARFSALLDPMTAEAVLSASEELFRQAGLSRPKQRALLAVGRAVRDGLDLTHLCGLQAGEAIARLSAVPGIGPWTAEVYLLVSAGHPDVFPARDVALQSAVAHGLGLASRPGERDLIRIAESWSPWRGVAARLFWSYYRTMRGREGAPVPQPPEKARKS
jgi:DNA-3-methyladenine glycosylase II